MPKIYFEKIDKDLCDISKKPEPASRLEHPLWWEDIPRYNDNKESDIPFLRHRQNATIKNCPSVNDSMNFGYVVYLPFDIYINAENPENVYWYVPEINTKNLDDRKDKDNLVGWNSENDIHSFYIPEGYHKVLLKLNTLWGIKTDPGYSCWMTQPMYRKDLPLLAMDGVIDTDVYPSRFPSMFFVKSGFVGIVKSSTPILQVIPFKREEYFSEIVELDIENIKKNHALESSTFSNFYKKVFWSRKKFN